MKYINAGDPIELILIENKKIIFENHNHVSKYIVGLVLHGPLTLYKKNKTSIYQTDDLFIIPIYTTHALELKDASIKLLVLCVSKDIFEQNTYNECHNKISTLLSTLSSNNVIQHKHLSTLIESLDIIYNMHSYRKEMPDIIDNAIKKIVSTPEKKYSLDTLADSIYVNKYYFIRIFKNKLDLTPHYFHIQNRIRKAQRLLSQGWTVADTAVETGFYDQSHFDKSFRKVVGISPQEYLLSIYKN